MAGPEAGSLIADAFKQWMVGLRDTTPTDPFDLLDSATGIRLQWEHREHVMPNYAALIRPQSDRPGREISNLELETFYPVRIVYLARIMEDDDGKVVNTLLRFLRETRREINKLSNFLDTITFPQGESIFMRPRVASTSPEPKEVTDQPYHHGIELVVDVSVCEPRG